MANLQTTSNLEEVPSLHDFLKENWSFLEYNVPEMVEKYKLPKKMDGIILPLLWPSDGKSVSVENLIDSCLKGWYGSLKENRRRKPDRVQSLNDRRNSRKDSLKRDLNTLFSEVLGADGTLVDPSASIDLKALRKLCGLKEGDEDPSVAFCSLCGDENAYDLLMRSLKDGGFREVIENEIIRRFTNKNSGGGLGDKTKPVVFEALQHAGGKTVEEVCHSIDETLGETEDRHSENQRKSNIFKAIMKQLGGLEPENTIDETALRRLLRIPEDGYSMKIANQMIANYQEQNFFLSAVEILRAKNL